MRKRKSFNLKNRIVQALRRLFFYSRIRGEALDAAKVIKNGKTQFRCAITNKLFPISDVAVDHIDPCVNPQEGFVDWNTFIQRLFCVKSWSPLEWDISKLQVISKIEHSKKTAKERKQRKRG
jgi:hypothetical protein